MKTLARATRLIASLVAMATLGCGSGGDGAPVDSTGAQIINGAVPSHGALEGYGVVSLGGCTGTLVTNQHVLTAHHCVRDGNNLVYRSATLETLGGTDFANAASIFEASTTVALQAADFALIELDKPLVVSGADDSFFNLIYTSSNASLLNKQVLCIGYGGTVQATANTPASGFSTLTSATLPIDYVDPSGWHQGSVNGSGQVGFGGDSGSSCFFNGRITGIQSNCPSAVWFDSNHDMINDGWAEAGNVTSCRSSSPSNFRSFVQNLVKADASIAATFVPPLAAGVPVTAVISTPGLDSPATITGGWSASKYAFRSGYFQVHVDEPPNVMCPVERRRTPLSGTVAVNTTCLSDALLPVLLASL